MNAKHRCLLAGCLAAVMLLASGGCKNTSQENTEGTAAESAQETAQASITETPTNSPEETAMEKTVETITFEAADGLRVTGDLYLCGKADAPFILLFHQARYSRGEYLEIAPKLNDLGYNCLAIDQRSGDKCNGVSNQTRAAADAQGLSTNYPDAYPDLEGALSYIIAQYAPKELIVWGSSYSSSLTLILASEHPQEIQAALAFSPGEYFQFNGQTIADYAKAITQPVFITSAKSEESSWRSIADAIPSEGCMFFVPEGQGVHGSSALFASNANYMEYWNAVETFLSSLSKF